METGQTLVSVVGITALGYTLVNYLRALVNLGHAASRSAAVSQTIAYGVFVGLIFLAGADAGAFGQIAPSGTALNDLGWEAKVLVGLSMGGVGGAFHKFLQARDGSDSASVDSFLRDRPPEPPQ